MSAHEVAEALEARLPNGIVVGEDERTILRGYFEHIEAARDEFEPRGTDICPQCGSGHTYRRVSGSFKWLDDPIFWFVHYHCMECFSKWGAKQLTEPETFG